MTHVIFILCACVSVYLMMKSCLKTAFIGMICSVFLFSWFIIYSSLGKLFRLFNLIIHKIPDSFFSFKIKKMEHLRYCRKPQRSTIQCWVSSCDEPTRLSYRIYRHKLGLNIGSIIMFSRNIEPQSGLLNGMRLFVNTRSIEARILTRRLWFILQQNDQDPKLPFKLVRGQFPVVLAFALTINYCFKGNLSIK